MAVLDRKATVTAAERNDPAMMQPAEYEVVFTRDLTDPTKVEVRRSSATDLYDVGFLLMGAALRGTTILHSFHDPGRTLVVPRDRPGWETWLAEVEAPSTSPSTVVGQQIEEIQEVTGLSDHQLAAAFPGGVSRETVNRWRNLPTPNLRASNLYRLGVLHQLARRIEDAGIDPRVWLHQPLQDEDATPYRLICGGQLGRVRAAVDAIAAGYGSATEPMRQPAVSRDWDAPVDEPEDEEDGEWDWGDDTGEASD